MDKPLAPPPDISARAQPHVGERRLILRARAGDRAAFEALYLRHHDSVEEVCRRWLHDDHLAEDAVQETFLRAWLALPRYATGDFTAWLRTIARNHCADVLRAVRRRPAEPVATERMSALPQTAPPVDVKVAEQASVDALLSRLAARDAALLRGHHMLGLPLQVLATHWNLTRGAMEVAVHRARQRARRVAERMDLRGLVPADVLRRLHTATERYIGDLGGVSSGAVVLCHLAVVAAAVAGSTLGWGTSERSRPPQARSTTVTLVTDEAQENRSAASSAHQARSTSRDAAPHRGPAAPRNHDAPPRSTTRVATFDPVAVLLTGTSIRSGPEPHWQVRRRYGVRNPTTGGNVVSSTSHKHDDESVRTVDDNGCTAADAAEPTTLTYCE